MPNILKPRLHNVRTDLKFVKLRVSYEKVRREMNNRTPSTLRKMGITPQGIQVNILKQFLATLRQPLKKFRIRADDKMDFRNGTLCAVLGRFGEGTLIERYSGYAPIAQSLAKSLLEAYVKGDVVAFLDLLLALRDEDINQLYDKYGGFFGGLDFSGLLPDFSKLTFSYLISRKTTLGRFGDNKFSNVFHELRGELLVVAETRTQRQGAYLFSAFLRAMGFKKGGFIYGGAVSDANDALKLSTNPDPALCLAFAQLDNRDMRARLDLHKLAKNVDGMINLIQEAEAPPLINSCFRKDYLFYLADIKNIYLEFLRLRKGVLSGHSTLGLLPFVKNYDLVVAVARQGLRCAYLVEMAGVPLYIADAHGHNGENVFKWLSKVDTNQFKEKKILVLEDDVVKGGTLKLVLNELKKYSPGRIDLCLTNPKHASGTPTVLNAFHRKKFLKDISKEVEHDEAVKVLQNFIRRQWAYLNEKNDNGQSLQDIVKELEIRLKKILRDLRREKIMSRGRCAKLKRAFYRNLFKVVSPQLEIPEVALAAERQLGYLDIFLDDVITRIELSQVSGEPNLEFMFDSLRVLPERFKENIAEGIYKERVSEYFDRHFEKVGCSRGNLAAVPHDIFEALKLIRQVMDEKNFDVVLVVGPEGCKYAVPFELAEIPLVEIYIDDFDKSRPYQLIDDLSILKGKRILLLEDDVNTGSTLRRTLEHVLPHKPQSLELFLGNPADYQTLSNVPSDIKKVHTVTSVSDKERAELVDWFLGLAGLRN